MWRRVDGRDGLLVVVVEETHCYLFLVDKGWVGIERFKTGRRVYILA